MDINGSEFLVIALLALILVGPERLPEYVRGLRSVVLRLRALLRDGQDALKDELGTDVDWNQLDPRNYDPRRIVREALFDDEGTPSEKGAATGSRRGRRAATRTDAAAGGHGTEGAVTGLTPFDAEAT